MTRKEFIEYLESHHIDFELSPSGVIVITHQDDVDFNYQVTEIPSGVEFRNLYQVRCTWVKTVNPNVIFRNKGKYGAGARVWLPHANKIYPGVEFHNEDSCILNVLEQEKRANTIPFSNWEGNIEGVDSNRLLNLMISKGIFL